MRGGGDVIFLATRPPPAAPLPRGSGPEDAAAASLAARCVDGAEPADTAEDTILGDDARGDE